MISQQKAQIFLAFCSLVLCCVSTTITAQTILRAAPGTVFSYPFSAPANVDSWTINAGNLITIEDGAPSDNMVNVICTPSTTDQICPASGPPAGATVYTVRGLNSNGDLVASQNFAGCRTADPASGRPIEIVMVVDVSGSMGDYARCPTCPSNPPNTPCDRGNTSVLKLDYLKEKLLATYNALKAYMEPDSDNKLGLVTFEDVAVPRINPPKAFNDATLSTDMNDLLNTTPGMGLQPLFSTAMGAGLQMGAGMFSPTAALPENDPIRIILLFTNGVQNVDPMVTVSGGQVLVGGSALPNNITIIPYAIFTPNDTYYNLLSAIASANGGTNTEVTTSPYSCALNQPLKQNWVNSVESLGSPKLVQFKNGVLSGTSGQETFSIKENMDRLSITISSVGTHNYTSLKVEKTDGGVVDLTPFGTITPPLGTPSQHRVFSVTFPVGAITNTAGDYRISFTANQADLAYDLSAIVDDRGLEQHFFASAVVAAGETMHLGARLFRLGVGLPDANVKAILYRPKKRLGNGFAHKNVPAKFIKVKGPWGPFFPKRSFLAGSDATTAGAIFSKGNGSYIKQITINDPALHSFQSEGNKMQNGEKKYLVLLNETSFSKVYDEEIIATIPLTHVGDGVYRAEYKGTKKTGIYRVRFEASGTHPQIGTYLRREEKTPLVRFGTPDRHKSCLLALYDEPPVILLKPVDVHGNLLGPNQIEAIKIETSSGTVGKLVDYLDGRYVFQFTPSSTEPDPTMSIRIHDRLLFQGRLSDIRSKSTFLTLQGGLTAPHGALDNTHGQGYFGEAKLGMRVYKQWGLQLKGGYYAFQDDETGKKDFGIWGFGPGVVYRQWINLFTGIFVQGEVHGAFYKPKANDWAVGYNAELAFVKPINHFLNVSLSGGTHWANTKPNYSRFTTLGLGLQWRF